MDRYLSLSRAARLVGVKRGTLQKRIQDGEIKTFEGMLSLEELLRAYPQTEVEDNTMIERASRIKDMAFNKILHETEAPNPEILALRISRLGQQLAETRSLAKKYAWIVSEFKIRLDNLDTHDRKIAELKAWLDKRIQKPTDGSATAELVATDSLLSMMTSHVRILPSGHDFFVEGTSSLLEAGLRAGLALDYACSNGNCGKCRAKLISGEVNKIQPHDYVLTDTEKAEGTILMCSNAAVTDVVLEAHEASNVNDIPHQHIPAKVKKIDDSHPRVTLLHLKTPRSNRLRFLAGQFVTLGDDRTIPIAEHSISSCPCDDMNLHFQIPRVEGNAFSDYITRKLRSGDTVDINGPKGEFILNEDSYHSLVFIAWRTGFASIRSLIEHAMALDIAENITLYWIAPDKDDRYLRNLCRSWDDALENFNYRPIDADFDTMDPVQVEMMIEKIFNEVSELDDLDNNDFYVAGNKRLITACEVNAAKVGLPFEQIKYDTMLHN